jgi:hypothetical protein
MVILPHKQNKLTDFSDMITSRFNGFTLNLRKVDILFICGSLTLNKQ